MTDLIEAIAADPTVADILDRASSDDSLSVTSSTASRPVLLAAVAKAARRPLLAVTSTFREAEQLNAVLGTLLGDDQVCYYPAWETLPHERLSPRSDTVARRLSVLRRIAGTDEAGCPAVVIAPIRSMQQPQVAGLASMKPVVIRTGHEYEMGTLAHDLIAAAYSRVDLVERRGEFAMRGGIVDVFPPGCPVRI